MSGRTFDVAVVGGGPAGCAAALTLLRRGEGSVCIVEGSDFGSPRVGETIPPDANRLLADLGIDGTLAAAGHLPCYGSHALWGGPRLGHNDFLTSPHGTGWHLDRAGFDRMLFERAVAAGAIQIRAACTAVRAEGDRIVGLEAGGETVTAGGYIDATGRGALLLRAAGGRHRIDDRLCAIWARFRTEGEPLGRATWLEAAPDGWWYAAGIPGEEAVVALGTDPRLAKAAGLHDLRAWAVALSSTTLIGPKLAPKTGRGGNGESAARLVPGSLRIAAAQSYLADRFAGPNWIAAGDAASAFDPLSSAGIYKALSTGRDAAAALIDRTEVRYEADVRQSYAAYKAARTALYRTEPRWPDTPFWTARHKAAA